MKIAVLGFAHGHVNAYCQQWRERPELGIEVAAGWDHDAGRLAKSNCRAVANLDELLADREIKAVVIAAETLYHAELAEKAAAAGKAIVLQKPVALTLEQADRICVAAEKVPFTLAWQMRVDPHNLQAKSLMASGRFGKLLMVRRRHCLGTHLWKDFDKLWHNDPKLNRDIFADDAAHAVDFLFWLRGMPASVMCEMATLVDPRVPNDNAIAVFRWADGVFGEMVCSFTAPGGENCLELTFEKGVIVGNYMDATTSVWPPGGIQLKWRLHDAKEWTVSELPDIRQQGQRIAGLAAPLAEFLQGKRAPIATAAEGRDVLRCVLACYESAAKGKRINL
jgi:predicted dehydrogenase